MLRMRLAAALVAVLAITACSNSDNPRPLHGHPRQPVPGGPRDSGPPARAAATPRPLPATPPRPTRAIRHDRRRRSREQRDVDSPGGHHRRSSRLIRRRTTPRAAAPPERRAAARRSSSRPRGPASTASVPAAPKGFWTDPAGNVFGPNNPNCLDYGSDGSPGNDGKGSATLRERGAGTLDQSGRPGDASVPHEVHPHRADHHVAFAQLRAPGADVRRQRRVRQPGDELLLVGERRGAAASTTAQRTRRPARASWSAATTRRRRTPGPSTSGSRRSTTRAGSRTAT